MRENNLLKTEVTLSERFMQLFKGLKRAYGSWDDIGEGRATTLKTPVEYNHYSQHLVGMKGLGIIPINEDNECYFGAIDIDDHKKKKQPIIHRELAQKVSLLKLPLVVCKSKSGGAHCYYFTREAIPASQMRQLLLKWAKALGFNAVEIFPKQTKLGESEVGNWINLPYFGNKRYAHDDSGKALSFAQFVEHAEGKANTALDLLMVDESDDKGIPPCLEHLLKVGVTKGDRNNAMFNMAVYNKKARPETWEEELFKINYTVFDPPLSNPEIKSLIKSVTRTDYRYKCKDEPICSLCDATTCKQREFGIDTSDPLGESEVLFGGLTKIDTLPPRWELDVSGETIVLLTEELLSFKKVRVKCLEACNIFLPDMTAIEWQTEVRKKLEQLKIEEAPEEVQEWGMILDALQEYIKIGRKQRDKDVLMSGPVLYEVAGLWFVAFQLKNFEAFLKAKRIPVKPRVEMYQIMRSKELYSKKLRSSDSVYNCWLMRVEEPKSEEELKKVLI